MSERLCLNGGAMVGMDTPVPEDPAEHYTKPYQWIGCNRIYCDRCRCWVRRFDRYRIAVAMPDLAGFEALYALEDPAKSPHLWPEKDHRTYVCKCNWDDTETVKLINSANSGDWNCAGHPSKLQAVP